MSNEIEKNMLRDRAKPSNEITDEMWAEVNSFNRNKVEEFLEESTHLSVHSQKQYKSALKIFYHWVHSTLGEKKLIYQIKKKDFMRFQNFLIRRGLSSNAVKLKRSAISSLNKYLINFYEDEEEFATFRNFVEGVPNPVLNKTYEKVVLSLDEIDLIYKTLIDDKKYQELLGFMLLYTSGCRRGELIQVKKEVVDYEQVKDSQTGESKGYYMTNTVRGKGKGELGEQYPLLFDDKVKELMKLWLEQRGEDDNEFLFISKRNNQITQISTSTVNYWFKEIFSDIVGRRVNPHITRSSRSTHILESGADIKKAQHLLRHKQSSTTEQFYDLRKDKDDLSGIF
ncbi:tyrosine-type recombinase/integrase [Priestia flexa]|uniref:tyrosine-type recombinase/integrase n=1 Tax=Priestia flexa TaxID=86664 RepID=UPI0004730C08|nr:tyrosine-type recombinase/integrase [Priestia flexa]